MAETTAATATFLFTDIEGSTELLKQLRGDYATLLATHHRLLRQAFEAHGGREVDNQGDSFFVAFARAKDAVMAAADAQRALAEQAWPDGASVRVRMGVHTGEAELASERYIGLSVHRAARISALAHGGQVLVSPTTVSLLDDEDNLPGIGLKDVGDHQLKDITRPVRLHQLEIDGLQKKFPPPRSAPSPRGRRRRAAVVLAIALVVAIGAGSYAVARGENHPPRVIANSLVRLDPTTLKPTYVIPIPAAADLVVTAGGYVWITHHILRRTDGEGVRNAGDRTLTRVDPGSGDVVTVGGGLAPCGITADPSGDVWVANCYVAGSKTRAEVVRVDAKTLHFETLRTVPAGDANDFYRGLVYGGGSLWVSGPNSVTVSSGEYLVTQIDPTRRGSRAVPLSYQPGPLAWPAGYSDLWASNFSYGKLTRLHTVAGAATTVDVVSKNPGPIVADGDLVWVGDWAGPHLERVHVVGPPRPHTVTLPTLNRDAPGVWSVAAGEGYIWAATPQDSALWRIDPTTDAVTRIPLAHSPAGVTTGMGGVWVVVRDVY